MLAGCITGGKSVHYYLIHAKTKESYDLISEILS